MRSVRRRDQLLAAVAPASTTGAEIVTPTATAAPARRAARRPGSSWVVAAVGVIVGAFALVVAWAVSSGAIHRAYSDDWAYLRIAHQFLNGAGLHGVGWNDTSLLGQVLASKLISPLAGSTVAGLRVVSIAAAAGSLVLVSVLGRHTRARALWPLAPLTLIAMPGFASTVATYMTEQLALFTQLLGLVIGLLLWRRWERTGRLPLAYLGALVVAGAWAGSIRQPAMAAVLAVAVTLLTHPRARRADRWAVAGAAGIVALFVLVLAVTTPLSGPTMAIVRGSISGQLARIYQAGATVALFLVPVAIVTGWFRRIIDVIRGWWSTPRGRGGVVALAAVVGLGGIALHHRTGSLLVGNSLQQTGGYQGTDLVSPDLFSAPVWFAIEVVAAAALFLLAVLVVHGIVAAGRRVRRDGWRPAAQGTLARSTPLARMMAIWATLALLAALAVNLAYRAIYDRYLLPTVIGLAILALDTAVAPAWRPRRLAVAAVAFVPLLLLGIIGATDTQDLLELRWAGGDRLVQLGYQPDQIDAGFDWVGYHYPGTARPDHVVANPPDYPPATYDSYFPAFRRCAFVSPVPVTPPPNFSLVDTVSGHRLFGLESATFYLYGVPTPTAPGACLASGQG